MIRHLKIENFKSIKTLDFDCGRINIFIGRPNSGKSNILESLSLLSYTAFGISTGQYIKEFVRVEKAVDLFHRGVLDHPIVISVNGDPGTTLEVKYHNGSFKGIINNNEEVFRFESNLSGTFNQKETFAFTRYYIFKPAFFFGNAEPGSLIPPRGRNFLTAVLTSEEIRSFVSRFLRDFGLKLNPRQHESKIEVQKEIDEIVFSFPYTQVSDTVQSIIFYCVAMKSNRDATLVFEDPGMHAFPYYNKYLGERIALDASNQYFICTHNPYFLLSVMSKAPKKDIKVFITHLKDESTRVKELREKEISQLLDLKDDPFFSIDAYLEDQD